MSTYKSRIKRIYPKVLSFDDCPLKIYTHGKIFAFHPYYKVVEKFLNDSHYPTIFVDGVLFDPSEDYTVYHPLEQQLFNFYESNS